MNNKLVSVIVGLVLVIGIGTLVYTNKKFTYQPAQNNTNTTNQSDPKVPGFTLSQIEAHKDASSCWTAINGSVYDLTSWIPKHPGGAEAILWLCGKDGTEAFNKQHGGSNKIAKVLGGFKVGLLTQ